MPRPPRLPLAALFDWDGTLIDTLPLIYRANVVALREVGIEMTRAWYRERYTPDWRRSYTELGVPEHLWDAVGARWAEEMARGTPRAIPWTGRALRRLRSSGVRLGLVTASTRAVVEPNLRRLNLEDLFEVVRCSDEVARSKPWPDALLEALDELAVAAADTVYVGDTTVDLEMARAAGAPFVAVGVGHGAARFAATGVEPVWSSVAAWVDDLLGPAGPGKRSVRQGPLPVRHT